MDLHCRVTVLALVVDATEEHTGGNFISTGQRSIRIHSFALVVDATEEHTDGNFISKGH